MLSISPFQHGAQVVAYLRDSGGDDQDLSVPQQEASIAAWCVDHGLILTRIFKDLARPGSSVISRDGFNEMMHYLRAAQQPEAGLLIWNYQRFSRSLDDSQFYRADIRRHGYLFFSLNDEIPEGPIGKLFEAIIDWKNEQFLLDLSVDIKRGLRALVEKYHVIPGVPPRGYKREPLQLGSRRDGSPHTVHRWVPDPETWDRCCQAFEMRARNASYAQIQGATHLFGSLNSYKDFFTNAIYHGELHYADLVIPDAFEPLVDENTWQAVQKVNGQNSRNAPLRQDPTNPRRRASHFLLSGLVRCARCGGLLNGHIIKVHKKPGHDYYACSTRQRKHTCDAQQIPRAVLEKAVVDHLVDFLNHPEVILAHQAQQAQDAEQEAAVLAAERADLNRRLANVRRRINNVNEVLADQGTDAPRSTIAKLAALEAEETEIQTDLAKIKHDLPPATHYTLHQLHTLANRIQRLYTLPDPEPLRQVFLGIIATLTVERDGSTIRGLLQFYLPPEPESKEGEDPSGSSPSSARKLDFMPTKRCPCPPSPRRHKFTISFNIPIKSNS
jgi:DNA invertase Pin-like site-specific DNA recombinase